MQQQQQQITALFQELTQKNGDLLECCRIPLEHYIWSDNLLEKALIISSCTSEIQQKLDQLHLIGDSGKDDFFNLKDSQIEAFLSEFTKISQELTCLTDEFEQVLMQDLIQSTILKALALKEEIRLLQMKLLQRQTHSK